MGFLIDVRYVPQGILVNGARFPIVRMPWISGQRLDSWIDDNLTKPHLVDHVRGQVQDAVARMRAAGVAHGDLQHGNILVDPSAKVWLIDYDGMYLPSLAALGASESGHRNYQHPDRGQSYHADLDLFASAVIDLSLDAVRHDPRLWRVTGENLLFEQDDFAAPGTSRVFAALDRVPALRERARRLRDACGAPFSSVPGILAGQRPAVHAAPATPRQRPSGPQALSCADRTALLARVGDTVPVVGKVTAVHVHHAGGKTMTFINFGNFCAGAFTIVAFTRTSRALAGIHGERCEGLKGRWVTVTSLVTSYTAGGRKPATPQITLDRALSLQTLSADRAKARLAGTPVDRGATSGVYRMSTPAKPPTTQDSPDDVLLRASQLYSTPGFAQPSTRQPMPAPVRHNPQPRQAAPPYPASAGGSPPQPVHAPQPPPRKLGFWRKLLKDMGF